MSATKTAAQMIEALGKEFPDHVIKTKPGSKPGAAHFKPATKYVSHGSVTKRINDVCAEWSSRVVEMHSYMNGNGMLVCAGVTLELTIPGLGSRQEFGTAAQPRGFGDDAKNAMSDALKRCAMRFGVALDLWESADENDEDADDYAGSQSPYQKDGGDIRPNRPPQPTSAPRSNGSAPTRAAQPPTPQRPPQPPTPALAPDDPLADVLATLRGMETRREPWAAIKKYGDEQGAMADDYGKATITSTLHAIATRRKAAAPSAPQHEVS